MKNYLLTLVIRWSEWSITSNFISASSFSWSSPDGIYKIKFSWNEDNKPPVVDTEGTPITDDRTPIYSGSQVKLAFYQKPYLLKDGVTYGTSLKIQAIQVVALNGQAGVDVGDMTTEDAAALFGNTAGVKQAAPNVSVTTDDTSEEDEF